MKKHDVITAVIIVLVAALVITIASLLVMSLIVQFSPKPTQYPNTVWVSDDGAFTLTVGEYNSETYQCDAELVYSNGGEEYRYTVSDGANSIIGVYASENNIDRWLRVKCNSDGFTARVNRTAELEYSGSYEKNQKVRFSRVS